MEPHTHENDLMNLDTLLSISREYLGLDSRPSSEITEIATLDQDVAKTPRFNPRKKNMNNYRRFARSLLLATGLGAFVAGPAFAETGCSAMSGGETHYQHHAKMMEEHHKQLHEALKLSPEQEPAWKKLMDAEQPRPETSGAKPEDWSKLTTPERAEKTLALAKARQEHMSEYVAALKDFYATLSAGQKKTFEDMHAGQQAGRHGKSGMHPHHPGAAGSPPPKG